MTLSGVGFDASVRRVIKLIGCYYYRPKMRFHVPYVLPVSEQSRPAQLRYTFVMTKVDAFDRDGALSRAYLLSRGECCGNKCRNCPYDHIAVPNKASSDTRADSVRDTLDVHNDKVVSM